MLWWSPSFDALRQADPPAWHPAVALPVLLQAPGAGPLQLSPPRAGQAEALPGGAPVPEAALLSGLLLFLLALLLRRLGRRQRRRPLLIGTRPPTLPGTTRHLPQPTPLPSPAAAVGNTMRTKMPRPHGDAPCSLQAT